MNEAQKYEWVEQWAAGELKGTALKEFEEALKTDQELKELVTMHQDMNQTLGDSKKNAVRATLIDIREKNINSDSLNHQTSGNQLNILFGIVGFCIVLGLAYWLFFVNQQSNPDLPILNEQLNQQPSVETPEEKLKAIPEEIIPKETKEPSKKETPKESIKKVLPPIASNTKKPFLIAANFEPNSLLEEEMRDMLRGGETEIKLIYPINDETYPIKNTLISLIFKGQLESSLPVDDLSIGVLLFNNSKTAFEQMRPIWKTELNLESNNEGVYEFNLHNQFELKAGLYYYLIEDLNEEEYLKIGRIQVIP